MRKIARAMIVVALSCGSVASLAVAPAMASSTNATPGFVYPICNPAHPIYPCQPNW
jgi:Spy/CpxP family protein refolding chaperone